MIEEDTYVRREIRTYVRTYVEGEKRVEDKRAEQMATVSPLWCVRISRAMYVRGSRLFVSSLRA